MSSSHRFLKLPTDAVQTVRKIYNLDGPGRLEEAISILQDWIRKQDHIANKDFSAKYLEATLIACKGSVEKAKRQIDKQCTLRTLLPKFFCKVNVKMELQAFLDVVRMVPMPVITKDYCRVVVIKINNNNFIAENIIQYFQFNIILSEYMKANDYVNSYIVVHDMRQVDLMNMMTKLNTVEIQEFLTIIIECYGGRMKSAHVLTESKAIELLIKIVKSFVSEKIGNRIYIHATVEDLHKSIPKKILPMEYGGDERSIDKIHEEFIEELSSEKHVNYMRKMNKMCTDESRRHADKFNEEYMGMPGSFRSLCVD